MKKVIYVFAITAALAINFSYGSQSPKSLSTLEKEREQLDRKLRNVNWEIENKQKEINRSAQALFDLITCKPLRCYIKNAEFPSSSKPQRDRDALDSRKGRNQIISQLYSSPVQSGSWHDRKYQQLMKEQHQNQPAELEIIKQSIDSFYQNFSI